MGEVGEVCMMEYLMACMDIGIKLFPCTEYR
jgi:hypothetical protein